MPREVIRIARPAAKSKAEPRTLDQESERAERNEDTGALENPSRLASIDAGQRRALIAEAAYYRSLRHARAGHEVEDWLAAEQEVDCRLMAQRAQ